MSRNRLRLPGSVWWLLCSVSLVCLIGLFHFVAAHLVAGGPVRAAPRPDAAPVNYNRDIRPILSNACYACHGPDKRQRKARLRLDVRERALGKVRSGGMAIVPGDVDKSVVFARLVTTDPDERMPPADSGKELTAAEIDLVRRWIEQGAEWKEHWAYVAPTPTAVPEVKNGAWPRNPIDHFVLKRLEDENLEPSREADKISLARRLTFDLTGLPPTVEEIDQFLADTSQDSYDRLVDRLLSAPAYGERMAQEWLDAARYADTNGYHIDNHRDMWKWRDWVIDSFNGNQPFDQFTIEQLAGDMLPEPTTEQKVASGFNRNVMVNFEGGAIPEEYLTKYIGDRVTTTATVWMGLTMGCAECHDHKYDPITQKEYYQFYAFFHNVPEKGLDGARKNPLPSLKVPTAEEEKRLKDLDAEVAQRAAEFKAPNVALDQEQVVWETKIRAQPPVEWRSLHPVELDSSGGSTFTVGGDGTILVSGDNPDQDVYTIHAETDLEDVTVLGLEALLDGSLPQQGPGRGAEKGDFLLTAFEVEASPKDGTGAPTVLSIGAAMASFSEKGHEILKAIDGNSTTGWAALPAAGDERTVRKARFFLKQPIGFPGGTKFTIRLKHESERAGRGLGCFRLSLTTDRELLTRHAPPVMSNWYALGPFESKLEAPGGAYKEDFGPETELKDGKLDLAKTYAARDGAEPALRWRERSDWKDGAIHEFTGELSSVGNTAVYLTRKLTSQQKRSIVFFFGSNDGIRVWLNASEILSNNATRPTQPDDDRVEVEIEPGESTLLVKINNLGNRSGFYFRSVAATGGTPESIVDIVRTIADSRTEEQKTNLRDHFRNKESTSGMGLAAAIAKLKEERKSFFEAIPTTMVMQELEKPRETFVLVRGDYRLKGDKVTAAVPAFLPGFAEGVTADRMALAKWLVDPGHPLTSRVTVNRFWQQFFGAGIVKTSEDFGVQGERPSHPELLDWLAQTFIEMNWNVKEMLRLIVTSSTYRQLSRVTPDLIERDPQNRLFARGTKLRLNAEMIRDNSLALSGLLDRRVGGPSVRPYQPPGLWKQISIGGSFSSQYYVQSEGVDQYRRSLYVYWKRSLPYPSMVTFDAPSREVCVVRRAVTNTPLQALVLMNDPVHVEAARVFAQRILTDGGTTEADRMRFAFRTCLARPPMAREAALLLDLYQAQLAKFKGDKEAAEKLIDVGDSPVPDGLDRAELAAWTAVSNVLYNLDETITKR